jgi:hypothetical protein
LLRLILVSERFRRALGDNSTEKQFFVFAQDAGFDVKRGGRIEAPYPVADKDGVIKKLVTNPDFLVTNPYILWSMFAEVTQGSRNLPSKDAQLRVVEPAGVTNYRVVHGGVINELVHAFDNNHRREILLILFGWV